jgi:hypothetical protein
MAHRRGDPKTAGSGRAKGTPNKKTSLQRQKLAAMELDAETTVEAIRRGMTGDIGDLYDAEGNLRPLHELTEAQRWLIAGVEHVMKNAEAGDGKVDRVLKIKWADRAKYVEMAGRIHGLFKDKVEVTVADVGAKLNAARLRAAARNKPKSE